MWLNEEQRQLWSDKRMDLANLIITALVFGQIVSPTGYNSSLAAGGLFFYIALTLGAMRLRS